MWVRSTKEKHYCNWKRGKWFMVFAFIIWFNYYQKSWVKCHHNPILQMGKLRHKAIKSEVIRGRPRIWYRNSDSSASSLNHYTRYVIYSGEHHHSYIICIRSLWAFLGWPHVLIIILTEYFLDKNTRVVLYVYIISFILTTLWSIIPILLIRKLRLKGG